MRKIYHVVCVAALLLSSFQFSVAQQCGVIYVTPGGASGGSAGSRANPANLQYAMTLVNGTNNRLWLAQGNYTLPAELMLVNNIIIEGGFDPTNNWVKSNVPPTNLHRTNQIVLPPPANGTAIIAGVNVSGFRLQDLTLTMDVPNGVAATAYGIYLNGCSNYNIVRCFVTSAAGTPGVAGSPGAAGAPGGAGAAGASGRAEPGPVPGGAGGAGANPGGNGRTVTGYDNQGAGAPGSGPCPGAGGGGGSGPSCSLGCFGGPPSCGGTTPGLPGTPATCTGTNGTNGAAGAPGTIGGLGFFMTGAAGVSGGAGGDGSGGGGGGAGGGRQENGSGD